MKKLILAVACLGFFGCESLVEKPVVSSYRRIDNVVRIWVNSPNKYTYMYRDGGGIHTDLIYCVDTYYYFHKDMVKFVEDVEPGSDSWIEVTEYPINSVGAKYQSNRRFPYRDLIFHVNSIKNISGGENRYETGGKHKTIHTEQLQEIK